MNEPDKQQDQVPAVVPSDETASSGTARMDRRQAIQWMIAAGAAISVLDARTFGAAAPASGYGSDPRLLEFYKPGDLWPLTFTPAQKRTAAALCDVILPTDERSPSASRLNVHEFIDEWISAPYPAQLRDRKIVLEGLAWIEAESQKRFGKEFSKLSENQQHAICNDIKYEPDASPGFENAARFFAKFRNLTTGAFYTTKEGMDDIRYVGNVPLTKFDGPPPEVLAFLKLDRES